jgi:hypothetical protein
MKRTIILAFAAFLPAQAGAVTHTTGTVNGLAADIWSWKDASGNTRTVALKQEGNGNPGHGGYAIRFTYLAGTSPITINAAAGGDGGFGYFVSHERYRYFANGAVDTIASHIFHKDDSPLGLGFPATITYPSTPAGAGAERVVIQYGHYGTIKPNGIDPNTGEDSPKLPEGAANYAFYTLPATTTWVFQDGTNYPRIDVRVGLAQVVPPGGTAPTKDLLSFDMRGPYGVMVFDNGADGTVSTVLWGDQQYQFGVLQMPVTRSSTWTWQATNPGARYQALQAGAYEMGLFEPMKAIHSNTADDYSSERGYTSASFAASHQTSFSSCPGGQTQTMPSDGEWPYQSVQFSLPCGASASHTPTTGKKIAWGSSSLYGTSLTSQYNGQTSFPLHAFPSNNILGYNVCLVLAKNAPGTSATQVAAESFATSAIKASCPTVKDP